MAQTLANGIVVPNSDGGEAISSTGVAELRAVGTTADSALGALRSTALAAAGDATAAAVAASAKADAVAVESVARDDALADEIAGMEGMKYVGTWVAGAVYRINDVVQYAGDAWARLTAGALGTPGESPSNWGLVARKGDGGGFGELNETETIGLYDTVAGSMTQDQVVGLTASLATKRDIAPMVIAEGTNLNDVNTPGEHSQQFTAWATPALNYPGGASPVAGRLFVAANVARTQVTQFYVPFTSSKLDIWMRNYYNTWGSWERIGMASDLALKANTSHPLLYMSGNRNVAGDLLTGWAAATQGVKLSRQGNTVTLAIDVTRTSDLTTFADVLPIPLGFRPITSGYIQPGKSATYNDGTTTHIAVEGWWDRAGTSSPLRFRDIANRLSYDYEPEGTPATTATFKAGQRLTNVVSWQTVDAIPSSLPGIPA